MPTTLIQQKPDFTKNVTVESKLAISEMFSDTIQGEGIHTGVISTFIRLRGCTLKCTWCDTLDVWTKGNEYTFNEIFDLFESIGLIERFEAGQHMILTGGSPLKQEKQLIRFIKSFVGKYGFKPYIQVENEAVLLPTPEFVELVDWWNNSPKLDNSGMKEKVRIKPQVLAYMGKLPNSTFKFVVNKLEDWAEIQDSFITPGYILKNQIVIMPEGQTRLELDNTREIAADIAIKQGVRFTDRLHVTIWNKKTGV